MRRWRRSERRKGLHYLILLQSDCCVKDAPRADLFAIRHAALLHSLKRSVPRNEAHFCTVTKNKHLLWFRRILDEHFEGIIAHATFNIFAGRIEGINNKIKTLRRKGYGYPDDDYFFLKLFDVSRKPYIRNPLSHNFYD